MNERVDVFVGNGPDGAALATITTAGSALRYKFLSTKGSNAITALARVKFYKGLIDEFHGCRVLWMFGWNPGSHRTENNPTPFKLGVG